jgi:hypothetical protein
MFTSLPSSSSADDDEEREMMTFSDGEASSTSFSPSIIFLFDGDLPAFLIRDFGGTRREFELKIF